MTRAEARVMALQDIVAILGEAEYDGRSGTAPAYEANKFLSDKEKRKIRREFGLIINSLYGRKARAEKEVERARMEN